MTQVTIYLFADADMFPKYVGKTNNLNRRIGEHFKDCFRYNKPFFNWLKKQLEFNKEFFIEPLEVVEAAMWEERERYWINHFRELGFRLYNLTDGGYDKKNGSKLGQKYAKNLRQDKKPVLQYDLHGRFIKEWESITEVASKFKSSTSTISHCCKEKTQTAKGFAWRYKIGNDIPLKTQVNSKQTPVDQYSKEGILLNSFNSIKQASRYTGISEFIIQEHIKQRSKFNVQYIWRKSRIPNDLKLVSETVNEYYS